jgi:hypothetical protein
MGVRLTSLRVDAALLQSCAGDVRPAALARITLMRVVSDFRETSTSSPTPRSIFDRLLSVASRPAFERALTEAAAG